MNCFFPGIEKEQRKIMDKWLSTMDYQRKRETNNFSKSDVIESPKKVKKKVLPYYCLLRLTQLFDRIDKDNKGCIYSIVF